MPDAFKPGKSTERLFPFVTRARLLIVGRDALARNKRTLQCILISEDISDGSREQVLRDFKDYPVLQRYSSAQFEEFFGARNAKVIGFKKSTLAKSIYTELKEFRLNAPPSKSGESPERSGSAEK